MATQSKKKLAESLQILKSLQDKGVIAIKSGDLSRAHRERLQNNGFIQSVMKGWYIRSRPEEAPGESTTWYASYWDFCASYLNRRFGEEWCLSPEQSLLLHAEKWTVPKQLLVYSHKGDNKVTPLPFETSLFNVRYNLPPKNDIENKNHLRVYSLAPALISSSQLFFTKYPIDTRAALATIHDASEILPALLNGNHSKIAGRLAGAFRNIGRDKIADEIIKTMQSAGYDVRENDPFENATPIPFSQRAESPYINRLKILWHQMRNIVIMNFSRQISKISTDQYLSKITEKYKDDAYHSLSIEGYRVDADLIEKVRAGGWAPDLNDEDKNTKNALAARGYWQAFNSVKESIEKILQGENAGEVLSAVHGDWYRELFSPSVTAGILKITDLAGYRNSQVFIRHSHHIPPNAKAVLDLMPTYFDLLREEKEASVRIVLGHFIFVYIHPYMDGNGRIGRFIMNAMCASGGYPWTIIPVEKRDDYMKALEEASVHQDIKPFCEFLSTLMLDESPN